MWQLLQKHILHNLRQFKESFMVVLIDFLNKKTKNSRNLQKVIKVTLKTSHENNIEKSRKLKKKRKFF